MLPWCEESLLMTRPTTSFELSLCSSTNVELTISYLDGSVISQTNEFYSTGTYNLTLNPPINVSAGLQVFRYSMRVDSNVCTNCSFPVGCGLSDTYPNPFN